MTERRKGPSSAPFRLSMRFEPHSVKSVVEAREFHDRLKEELKGAFRKGEKNIFFTEDSIYLPGVREDVQTGFKKYGSIKKGMAYASLRQDGQE